MPTTDILFAEPRRLGFLLLDGFSLMAYTSIIEPFRLANAFAGQCLYSWTQISLRGGPVCASNGLSALADRAVGDPLGLDTLFVFAGCDPSEFNDRRTFAWLRRLNRAGVQLAGISSGSFVLAKAGLLEGYRCTVHWDHVPTFIDEFPALAPEDRLYVIDRNRLTCAGGSAGLDMAIDLIEREQGTSLAVKLSDWFLRYEGRNANNAQRMSLRERYGVTNPKVLKVLAHMEQNVEEIPNHDSLTRIAGVSSRQLDRLFKTHLNASLGEVYRGIRLERADVLLRKTSMSVASIADACGFASSNHFSRRFKERYGRSPRDSR